MISNPTEKAPQDQGTTKHEILFWYYQLFHIRTVQNFHEGKPTNTAEKQYPGMSVNIHVHPVLINI